jgi:GNAT superfamily N-acetyltransferase
MPLLQTSRLRLVPLTLDIVEAVMGDRRQEAEALVGARMPERWPNRELVERAFCASLDAIRANPAEYLWGDRVMIARDGASPAPAGARSKPDTASPAPAGARSKPDPRDLRVIGSVIFRGRPGAHGIAEIAYGVEEASQGRGYATEAVTATLAWALAQSDVRAVQAVTFPWHRASLRVIDKVGMVRVGVREHETMGELLVFEKRR